MQNDAAKVFQLTSDFDRSVAQSFYPQLKYGENPDQQAVFIPGQNPSFRQLAGQPLSFNNYLDMEAANNLVGGLEQASAVIVKHTNPCGLAEARTKEEDLVGVFERALACDRKSAFGGVVGVNRTLDCDLATNLLDILKLVIAPEVIEEALDKLRSKPRLRVVQSCLMMSCGNNDLC